VTVQGQSIATIDKERRIGAALSVSMRIARARFAGKFRYYHFDANAGSGWNEKVEVEGSPIVFLRLMRTYLEGMKAAPFFCDINEEAMTKLRGRVLSLGNLPSTPFLILGDNEEGMEVFMECLRTSGENPEHIVGSVLVDPNGCFYRSAEGIGAPVKVLPKLCDEFPKIDVVLNINCRQHVLQKSHGWVPPLIDTLLSLKPYWLVSYKRVGKSNQGFLLAVGRSIRANDHTSLNFFHLDSDDGRYVIEQAEDHRGYDGYGRQMGLGI
jgi:hypothetical protein